MNRDVIYPKEKIVVLDGFTLNPGDLDWSPLMKLAKCDIYDRTSQEDVISKSAEATILITNKAKIDKAVISALPKLKYIGVLATGTDNIDAAYANMRGIELRNASNYSSASVAQLVFSLLLEISMSLSKNIAFVKNKGWEQSSDFSAGQGSLTELKGKVFGLIGLGNIGMKVAALANAFEMPVYYHKPQKKLTAPEYIQYHSFDSLLEHSDIISVHCPLTAETRDLINANTLAKMKQGAILINTSRGAIVNQKDLAQALLTGHIRAAGLDVLAEEPPHPTNPLLRSDNCIITPHIAWATQESRQRLLSITVKNLTNYLESNQGKNYD